MYYFFIIDKEGMQSIAFWLMGSLSGAKWDSIFYNCTNSNDIYLIFLDTESYFKFNAFR